LSFTTATATTENCAAHGASCARGRATTSGHPACMGSGCQVGEKGVPVTRS
jgi:hypothetical protein